MKPWAQYGVAALTGAALSLAVTLFAGMNPPERVVHAQTVYTPGCVSSIPKSWGSFRGISEDGMAFEDNEGTIRVIAHPTCGNGLPQAVRADLEIRRTSPAVP